MSEHVMGIGLGLFLLLSLWVSSFVLCTVSLQTNKNLLALIFIFIPTIITLILILIPQESETLAPSIYKVYDHLFACRISLLILLSISSIIGFIVLLFTHFMEPHHAQPLKTWKL